ERLNDTGLLDQRLEFLALRFKFRNTPIQFLSVNFGIVVSEQAEMLDRKGKNTGTDTQERVLRNAERHPGDTGSGKDVIDGVSKAVLIDLRAGFVFLEEHPLD